MVDTGGRRRLVGLVRARELKGAGVHSEVQAMARGATAAAIVDGHGAGSRARTATTRLGMAHARREGRRGAFSVYLNHLGSKANMATEVHVVLACCSRGHMSLDRRTYTASVHGVHQVQV